MKIFKGKENQNNAETEHDEDEMFTPGGENVRMSSLFSMENARPKTPEGRAKVRALMLGLVAAAGLAGTASEIMAADSNDDGDKGSEDGNEGAAIEGAEFHQGAEDLKTSLDEDLEWLAGNRAEDIAAGEGVTSEEMNDLEIKYTTELGSADFSQEDLDGIVQEMYEVVNGGNPEDVAVEDVLNVYAHSHENVLKTNAGQTWEGSAPEADQPSEWQEMNDLLRLEVEKPIPEGKEEALDHMANVIKIYNETRAVHGDSDFHGDIYKVVDEIADKVHGTEVDEIAEEFKGNFLRAHKGQLAPQ